MGLAWADHLSVGNAMIDSDHKNLIVAVNSVKHAVRTRDRIALSKAFKLFDTYMHIHFRNKEKIAEAVTFPFAQRKLEHLQLMNEMRYMIKKLEAKHSDWPDNLVKMYSRYLSGWIIDHIIEKDMQMKPVLQAYPYDFKPD